MLSKLCRFVSEDHNGSRDHRRMITLEKSLPFRQTAGLLITVVCVNGLAAADPTLNRGDPFSDHLIPTASEIDAAYRSLLSEKLFVTPADYARIVVMPSSASGEVSLAIYSRPVADYHSAHVCLTCTRADRNLWYSVSQSNPNRGKEPPAQVSRTDALLPKSAALAVAEAITHMLNRTEPVDRKDRIFLDGTGIEFSVENGKQHPGRGLLTPYAKGKLTDKLRQLVRALMTYCDAAPAERQKIATQIEEQATSLVRALKNSEKMR